ncbi:hypothetical protein NCC49_005177 [Naganishia albida]|nr:hypothetical protein NCC49_005177 [Naganishia albida]
MDPLLVLPPELVLEIITHLPLSSVPALRRTSREWSELIKENEEGVFRRMAQGLEGRCKGKCMRYGWKTVCQCAVQHKLMRNEKVACVDHLMWDEGFIPWRIKVDEERGLVFASTEEQEEGDARETQGGLLVLDLSTKTIIQRIPEIRVYAHIEYDAGYLVAAGRGDKMDVYRASDPELRETPASTATKPEGSPSRQPPLSWFGEISSPGFRALRLMGTTLATGSETRIELFDVPALELVQRIEIAPRQITMIMYIELDDEFVFLCGLGYAAPLPQIMPGNEIPHPEPMLYVYRRNPSPDGDAYIAIALGFDPSYGLIASQTPSPDPGETLDNDPRFNVDVPGAKPYAVAEVAPFELTGRVNGHDMVAPFRPDVPVACHYGTRNLVVLCRNGSILIVQDYKETFHLPRDQQSSKIFGLTLPSNGPEYWNLAVEGDLAYVTSYQGRLFVPWAVLVVIDLTTLQIIPPAITSLDTLNFPRASAQIDIRSWDIPLPNQMSDTHSLQATTEGVYLTAKLTSMRGRHVEDAVASGWVPEFYRDDMRPVADVLCLRYRRH